MTQIFGYAGKLLRVDLTRGEFTSEELDPAELRKYLGGMALGAKILYDEVRPGVDWYSPENRVIIFSGPLGGTRVMGSGTFCLVTKGALTEGSTSSQANGYLGAFLKLSGFDGIVIHGKAAKLSYLYIHDGQAELRECPHLADQSTWDTEDLIKQELGYRSHDMSVFSIGPAGERMVRFAVMMGDRCHTPGHNGNGAVLGSKNLKAVAVARGKSRVPVYDDAELATVSREILDRSKDSPMMKHGTLWIMGINAPICRTPYLNESIDVNPMTEEQLHTFSPEYLIENLQLRRHSCWACPANHGQIIRIPDGPLAGKEAKMPEYESFASMGTQLGIFDGLPAASLSAEVDRLGIDVNETGWLLGMLMECYEKGVLSEEDLDGIEMKWGSVDATRAMLYKVAFRQGVGDWLAEGVMRAASKIGGRAPEFSIHTMAGNTPRSHDHRRNWTYILDNSTSSTGSSEGNALARGEDFGLPPLDPYDAPAVARLIAKSKGPTPFMDCLGTCFNTGSGRPEYTLRLLHGATGWDMTWPEAVDVGLRSVNLLRSFNIRQGYDVNKDAPSPRYGETPTAGLAAGKNIKPVWRDMLGVFYEEMGWDRETGKPLPETLNGLGLDFVTRELWPS